MGEPQPAQDSGTEDSGTGEDPLAESIRKGIYAAMGLGLVLFSRAQTARRDLLGQMPDDLRDAFSDLAEQVPEDIRNVFADLSRQLPKSVLSVLMDAIEQAPALAEALREFVGPPPEQA